MSTGPDEQAWIDAARNGDAAAMGKLYALYHTRLYSHCVHMLFDRDLSEDVVHDAFISAMRTISTTSNLNMNAWMHRICTNRCLDILRRQQRLRWTQWDTARHDQLQHANISEMPEQQMIRSETVDMVRDVLSRMTTTHRTALVMREDGRSCAEIGRVLGKSRSAVKSALFRARIQFKEVWNEMGYGDRIAA